MSKSTQEKLFEFETNSSRRGTDGEVGTGFGMPILSKIVHAYGGKIKITSEEQAESKPGYTDVQLTLAGNFVSLNNSEVKFS
jgi:signal transduction histidine kinase